MKRLELVIFDCDGVQIDGELLSVRADNRPSPRLTHG
jgi:beta-phosphoglucomutase-like phosphatase (HAD superfamily)